jgi:DNA modification methylase
MALSDAAGTTGVVADRLGRRFVGFELHPRLAAAMRRRLSAELERKPEAAA